MQLNKPINISDVEQLQFLYKDEAPVDVEIWDTPDGQQHYCELLQYSQSYVQNKHGVIIVVNGNDYTGQD